MDFDLETMPLEIKTDSAIGSKNEVKVWFYTSDDELAGRFLLFFTSTLQYKIHGCTPSRTNFTALIPDAREKIWRVTKTNTSGIRLTIHCNEVEMVNIVMSNTTCGDDAWSSIWDKEIKKIHFPPGDTASDYYKLSTGYRI